MTFTSHMIMKIVFVNLSDFIALVNIFLEIKLNKIQFQDVSCIYLINLQFFQFGQQMALVSIFSNFFNNKNRNKKFF
jgi:hypothetical protein